MERDAFLILSMRIAGTVLWLGYTVLLARTLSQSDFAISLYVINFSVFAVLFITFGRDVVLLRFASMAWATGSRAEVRKMLQRSRMILFYNGCAVTVVLIAASMAKISTPVTQSLDTALLAGLLILAGAQMGLNSNCLRAVGRVWQSQIGINFSRAIIPFIGSAFVVLLDGKLSVQQALSLLVCSLLFSIALEEIFLRQIDWKNGHTAKGVDEGQISRAALALWPGDIANALMMRSVGLIGAMALPPETAALLLAAERIAGLAQFPISAAVQAATPRVARATNSGNEALQNELNQGSKLMLVGACIGCLGAGALAWPALWALGPSYLDALPTALMLIFASLAWAFFGLAQSALNLIGRSVHYSAISICVTIATALGIWLAATHYGGFAASVVWCIGWWTANIAYTIAFKTTSNFDTGIFSVGRQVFAYFKGQR